LTIFSLSTKKRRPHWSPEVLAPHKKFHLFEIGEIYLGCTFSPPDWRIMSLRFRKRKHLFS
jgi:hypothetical protein